MESKKNGAMTDKITSGLNLKLKVEFISIQLMAMNVINVMFDNEVE